MEVVIIKKIFTVVLVCLLIALSITSLDVIAARNWTKKQEVVHEIADLARSIGLPEDDVIIRRASEIWWDEDYSSKSTKVKSEPDKIYYSDTIRVLVTQETKDKIEAKVNDRQADINYMAQTAKNEAGGIPNKAHKAAVMWCILNRVDSSKFPNTVYGVVSAPNQFAWYSSTSITSELQSLARDVMTRYLLEKEGYTEVGRVLPSNYYYFYGDGKYNYFRQEYNSSGRWDWSLASPY